MLLLLLIVFRYARVAIAVTAARRGSKPKSLHTSFDIPDTIMTLVSSMITVVAIIRFFLMSYTTWAVIHLRTPRIIIAISMISLSFHPLI